MRCQARGHRSGRKHSNRSRFQGIPEGGAMHKSVNPGIRKLRRRCRLKLLVALLIVGLGLATAGSVVAQDLISRREIDTPGLVVEPENNARMGECDVLSFSPDGKQLLATGDDKVVRVWDLKEAEKGNKKELATAAAPV